MNKEKAIKNINQYGKIGKIITIVMLCIIGFSLAATLIAAVTLKVLPSDLINLSINSTADVTITPGTIDPNFNPDELNIMADAINNDNLSAGINMGVASFKLDTAEIIGDSLVAHSVGNVGNVSLGKIGTALYFAVIALLLTFISLLFGCFLCKAFEKCTSPFDNKVIKAMRNFAFSLIPWALYSSVPESILNSVFGNKLKMSLDIDFNVVFTVLIILALTIVFKYGAILQQESDETL